MGEAIRIYTRVRPGSDPAPAKGTRSPRRRVPRARSRGERLLRNSAVACALLLGILALGNLDLPWARKATEGIQRAVTMRIDLDESIGELTFVRALMPESALVFLNVTGAAELARPAAGEVTHPWTAAQPWLMFAGGQGGEAVAAAAGTVTAVSPLSGGGRVGILVDHGDGRETVYANLDDADVQAGDAVTRGQWLGGCGDGLYFEYRVGGESEDPSEKLGLR